MSFNPLNFPPFLYCVSIRRFWPLRSTTASWDWWRMKWEEFRRRGNIWAANEVHRQNLLRLLTGHFLKLDRYKHAWVRPMRKHSRGDFFASHPLSSLWTTREKLEPITAAIQPGSGLSRRRNGSSHREEAQCHLGVSISPVLLWYFFSLGWFLFRTGHRGWKYLK